MMADSSSPVPNSSSFPHTATPHASSEPARSPDELPEHLPPVTPPSAGFILQLFVVPGLIVLAIVAVWLLFGQLATGEQDWNALVTELQHPNEHRRWRGGSGLAQLLSADVRRPVDEQKLCHNPKLAEALVATLKTELQRTDATANDLKYQSFLARTLGLLDVNEVVVPVLLTAIADSKEKEVRKDAMTALATIGGRRLERKQAWEADDVAERLIAVAGEADPLLRQLAAFTLGFLAGEPARERLIVLLADDDEHTRLNAAIALARQDRMDGLPLFLEVLKRPLTDPAGADGADASLRLVIAQNSLRALEKLAPKLSAEERARVREAATPLSTTQEPALRIAAKNLLVAIKD